MTLQLSTSVRNARLDAIETAIGVSAILKIRTGAPPANCAAADAGTVLATVACPSDYLAAASSGSKAKSGTWEDTAADAAGTAAHFRLYASDGTTCHMQGTVTATGGGGDLTLAAELEDLAIAADGVVIARRVAFELVSVHCSCWFDSTMRDAAMPEMIAIVRGTPTAVSLVRQISTVVLLQEEP